MKFLAGEPVTDEEFDYVMDLDLDGFDYEIDVLKQLLARVRAGEDVSVKLAEVLPLIDRIEELVLQRHALLHPPVPRNKVN